jgi:hypothetical protein
VRCLTPIGWQKTPLVCHDHIVDISFKDENNFSLVVPTTHKLTPHIKGKKCKKTLHLAIVDFQLKKKEKRKKEKEES